MNGPVEEQCAKCRYFKPIDALNGSCRRYPPVFAGESSPREPHHWRFPAVGCHSWCGEFQSLAPTQAAPSASTM